MTSVAAVHVGILGGGGISQTHARAASSIEGVRVAAALRAAPHSLLVSVTRARKELLPAFAAEHGARRFHAEWKDLLRDEEFDAVYIATPVPLHAEHA